MTRTPVPITCAVRIGDAGGPDVHATVAVYGPRSATGMPTGLHLYVKRDAKRGEYILVALDAHSALTLASEILDRLANSKSVKEKLERKK